eukprot:4723661-Pleurochrysis_carterae.AAC.1
MFVPKVRLVRARQGAGLCTAGGEGGCGADGVARERSAVCVPFHRGEGMRSKSALDGSQAARSVSAASSRGCCSCVARESTTAHPAAALLSALLRSQIVIFTYTQFFMNFLGPLLHHVYAFSHGDATSFAGVRAAPSRLLRASVGKRAWASERGRAKHASRVLAGALA